MKHIWIIIAIPIVGYVALLPFTPADPATHIMLDAVVSIIAISTYFVGVARGRKMVEHRVVQ